MFLRFFSVCAEEGGWEEMKKYIYIFLRITLFLIALVGMIAGICYADYFASSGQDLLGLFCVLFAAVCFAWIWTSLVMFVDTIMEFR